MDTNHNYHIMTHTQVLSETESSKDGLKHGEAEARLEMHGPNVLTDASHRSTLTRIIEQLKNPMIIVLIAAGIISGIFSEVIDMVIILAVVVLNTTMGVVQEGKAEKALDALKAMSSPTVKVRRAGGRHVVPSSDIVPGDIIELEAGDYVCADLRILESNSLKIEEAALTGESVPTDKVSHELEDVNAALGDRINMAYCGTDVVYGRGYGVVVATGMQTEIGKIAHSITTMAEVETPIQRKLTELSKILSVLVLIACVVIFVATLIQDGTSEILNAFLLSVSLAVAAIPEGLPAVVTIIMAMGVQRMARKRAIIRKLPAVETLGSTEVVCTDKTGTLTQNRMTVMKAFSNGKILPSDASLSLDNLDILVEAMAFCNDSTESLDASGHPTLLGDPTETALKAYALEKGYPITTRLNAAPRIHEIPFDSSRKLMSTFHSRSGQYIHYIKGAPDVLLDRCNRILLDNGVVPMTDELRASVVAANSDMASGALRVLAAAMNVVPTLPTNSSDAEQDLVFVGLMGMIDPARPEVKDAVSVCLKAGMRPIMITGDHKDTAVAIAREIGILREGQLAITGTELDQIPEDEFLQTVDKYSVYARVSPAHKVKIVSAWQSKGKVCSMTGDGVNDAPALKKADIGVGMGITGTDVTKNVADMVLTDDNFATIIVAVEEGRKIYTNIRKVIQFLLSANLSEVLSVLVATLMGHHLLHTIHILWINLVSDSLPALALGIEPTESDIMDKPPRSSKEGIFAGGLGGAVAYQGLLLTIITLSSFFLGLRFSPEIATTYAFCTLTFAQMLHSLNVRSLDKSLFTIGFLTNLPLLGSILLSVILTFIVVMVPFTSGIFHLVPLNGLQWFEIALLSAAIIPVVELIKLIQRKSVK